MASYLAPLAKSCPGPQTGGGGPPPPRGPGPPPTPPPPHGVRVRRVAPGLRRMLRSAAIHATFARGLDFTHPPGDRPPGLMKSLLHGGETRSAGGQVARISVLAI